MPAGAPASRPEHQAPAPEPIPHFGIPGFEQLPAETQALYLRIPAARINAARPIIEREIARVRDANEQLVQSDAEIGQARRLESIAHARHTQATNAIDAFRRAARGDQQAMQDLNDLQRELLDEEFSDETIFRTVLENQSSNPFAPDTVLAAPLSEAEAQEQQDVLDLFKEFRGDTPSVDDILKPPQQLALFRELNTGGGSRAKQLSLLRQALLVLTEGGESTLLGGLRKFRIISNGELSRRGIRQLHAYLRDSGNSNPARSDSSPQIG